MMALNACPQPPDMSSISTCVVLSFCLRVVVRESGVIWGELSEEAWAAAVSVGAAIGVERAGGEVWKEE